jgi:hypothetical protein
MTDIYFDESGYTGTDLSNPEQPFFVIASSTLSDADANTLLQDSFPGYQGAEFKFTNIWRRDRHRKNLERFVSNLKDVTNSVFVWGVDKKFSLLIKMIDYVIEPVVYASGHDFYANGYARSFVYTVHRDLKNGAPNEVYVQTVLLWDRFARDPNEQTAQELQTFTRHQAKTLGGVVQSFFKFLSDCLESFIQEGAYKANFSETNEIQLTSMLSSVVYWRQNIKDDFNILHDQSSNFFKSRSMWSTLMRNDAPDVVHQLGNGSLVEFPLRVSTTTSLRSHDSRSVQFCDVVAGLFTKLMPAVQGFEIDPFLMELVAKGAGEVTMSGVNPERIYVNGPPPRRSGPDALDQMVDILRPELDRILSRSNGSAT